MLYVNNLNYCFGQNQVLKNINFSLKKGEIWALLGPNGSGKSTLLRCLAGMLFPQNGQVYYQSKELKHYRKKQLAREICFLPQNLMPLQYVSVYDFVAMGRSPHQGLGWYLSKEDKEKVQWALSYMQLTSFQHRLLTSLSGGERQRVWVSMILAQDAPVVLMDEPVTFLDLRYQWDLIEKILTIRNRLQKSFIIVLHDINHALALADQVLILKKGEIFKQGCPAEVITPSLLQEVYGIKAKVCRIPGNLHLVVIPGMSQHDESETV